MGDVDYRPPKQVIDLIRRELRKKRPVVMLLYLLSDYLLIFAPGMVLLFYNLLLSSILFAPIVWLASARGMRGLECIVHDASHFNFFQADTERTKLASDKAIDLFAAIPVFSTVERYRASHQYHHSDLGGEKDPDRVRHDLLSLDALERTRYCAYALGMIGRLNKYIPSWWRAIGTTRMLVFVGLCWHIFCCGVLSLQIGLEYAIGLWIYSFIIPFIFVLPCLRFVGEAAEHDYKNKNGITAATLSNDGFIHRLLIHPHFDGKHTLHHLFPHVPHCNLPRLEKALMEYDADGWRSHLRVRRRVLEDA